MSPEKPNRNNPNENPDDLKAMFQQTADEVKDALEEDRTNVEDLLNQADRLAEQTKQGIITQANEAIKLIEQQEQKLKT